MQIIVYFQIYESYSGILYIIYLIFTYANAENSFNFAYTSTGTFQVKHIFRFNLLKYTFREVATQPNI